MPQHPARHHAPAHQRHALADPEHEGQMPRHAHRLADLDLGTGPRVRVAKRQKDGLAPPVTMAVPRRYQGCGEWPLLLLHVYQVVDSQSA
jgi:hypothetical protein